MRQPGLRGMWGDAVSDESALWAERHASGRAGARARDRLIEAHLGFVRQVADQVAVQFNVRSRHVDPDDLISAGQIALIDLVDRFDEGRGVPFRAFARPRIRGAVIQVLRDRDALSRRARDKVDAVRDADARISQRHGRAATMDEIAVEMGVPSSTVRSAVHSAHAGGAAMQLTGEAEYGDWAAAPEPAGDDDDPGWASDVRRAVADALAALPDRDRTVVALYYFAERPDDEDARGLTMQAIAELLGMSTPWVNMVHNDAMLAVREHIGAGGKVPGASDSPESGPREGR